MIRLTARLWVLTGLGRITEAQNILDDAVAAVREVGNPLFIALVTGFGYGRVFADSDPARALHALREAVEYSRQHHLLYTELYNSYELAVVEIAHGDLRRGLELLDFTIDSWHRAGDRWNLAFAMASLAICLERLERPEAGVTVYGASTKMASVPLSWDYRNPVKGFERPSELPSSSSRSRQVPLWRPAMPSPTPASRSD